MDNIRIVKDGTTVTANVSGEIDHHTSKKIREEIDNNLDSLTEKLILDFSGVTFMDSSGLGLVMGRLRLCQKADIVFTLCGVPDYAKKMFTLSGMEKLL